MPWDEEGTDYDEPKSGGDSHEDEFDEEYGEQQPKGDPDKARADELAAAFEADIKFWENQGSDNRQQEPPAESETSLLTKELADFDDFTFHSAAKSVTGPLEDANRDSLTSHLSAHDPDDFDWAESLDSVGPPSPDGVAVPYAVAPDSYQAETNYGVGTFITDDTELGPQYDAPVQAPEASDSYHPETDYIIGTVITDDTELGPQYDAPVRAPEAGEDTSESLQLQLDQPEILEPDSLTSEPYAASSPSFDTATEFQSDAAEPMDSTEFLG